MHICISLYRSKLRGYLYHRWSHRKCTAILKRAPNSFSRLFLLLFILVLYLLLPISACHRIIGIIRCDWQRFWVANFATQIRVYSRELEKARWGEMRYPTRILCWGPTKLDSIEAFGRAKRILDTYASFCDLGYLFAMWRNDLQGQYYNNLVLHGGSVVGLDAISEDVKSLLSSKIYNSRTEKGKWIMWELNLAMWVYVEKNYADEVDWIFRNDDDTFFSPVQAKNFLQYYSPDVPHYLGLTMYNMVPFNFLFVSGASIGLSKAALQQLSMKSGWPIKNLSSGGCALGLGGDDTRLAQCLSQIGITPENTMDADGRHRFAAFFRNGINLTDSLARGPIRNCMKRKPTPIIDRNSCSDFLIAIHRPYKNVSGWENREWHFLHHFYNTRPPLRSCIVPPKPSLSPWDSSIFKDINHTVTLYNLHS